VGYGTCKPVCPSGAKYTAESHVRQAVNAGARVLDRVPVQRLEHDTAGERVEAAVYATPEGGEHRQTARHFVLACGGVENVRLLLLSSSEQYPDGLANGSGAVGRYFMDHLFAGAGGRLDRDTRQNHVGFNTSETHQFYDDAEPVNGMKLEFLNYAGPSVVGTALSGGSWGDDLLETVQGAYGTHIAMGALVEQFPDRENRITLDPTTTDDHGNPVPEIHWSVGERERAAIERANAIQHEVLSELGVDIEWTVGPESTGPAFHHMGTTRMGTDPESSVVDSDLRAHDLANLWIGGSSVFPTGGAMNPTLTIAALSVRLSERLEREL
jgi:choline dehydrogenase-like flavoprotein